MTTAPQTPRVGDPAPDFALPSATGGTVRLSDFRGKSEVVLYFYPKDNSPGCSAEACSFRDNYEAFREAGAEVIGVSSDPAVAAPLRPAQRRRGRGPGAVRRPEDPRRVPGAHDVPDRQGRGRPARLLVADAVHPARHRDAGRPSGSPRDLREPKGCNDKRQRNGRREKIKFCAVV